MRNNLLSLFLIFLLSAFSLFSQDKAASASAAGSDPSQNSKSIEETEAILDKIVFEINDRLRKHTPIFKLRMRTLPHRTILYKGKAKDNKCELSGNQEDAANNCLHLEVFDFVKSEEGRANQNLGAKNKYIELFYEGANNNDPDPRKEAPRNVSKIKIRILEHDFQMEDKFISEVVDNAPNSAPAHNDKIEVFYQKDGYPFYGTPETPSEKGVGKYLLANVENTKTNPIRNNFKKQYLVKGLDYFDKLLVKLFDYNDRDSNVNYKKNVDTLKGSLKY